MNHAHLYSPLSFWEYQSFLKYDYVIVGSGIVGLSTAAHLKEINRKATILVLERGIFPTGASTKNAGFACIGSPSEVLSDINLMGEEKAFQLIQKRINGLALLKKRLGNDIFSKGNAGGYELLSEKEMYVLDKISYLNQTAKKHLLNNKKALFKYIKPALGYISKMGFSNYFKELISIPQENSINTGKMMQKLLLYVQKQGVVVLNNTEVEEIKDGGSKVELKIKNNFQNPQNIYFEASKVAICTNAFAPEMFSGLNINAGRGQVLITKPIKNLPFRGNFHFDEGYYYFRDVDGERVLFGGGRNLDFEGENTTTFATTDKIINELVEKLSTIILPNQTFEIAQTWAGIMAFNTEKTPIVRLHTPNVALGVCLNGMGVAIGSIIGQETADLLV